MRIDPRTLGGGAACVAPTLSRQDYESLTGERSGPMVRYIEWGPDGPKQVIRPCEDWEDWKSEHQDFMTAMKWVYDELPPMFGMMF